VYVNPVIPGFHPDPSVCRVGEDYYLATSSFEYFPGVPVFHSRDLVHWRQIGHCLTREGQLRLDGVASSAGIYAPSLRYWSGRFYMVTTNVGGAGHFYVHTDDPAGEWSEPVWVKGEGFDPDLFFDDDGRVYFVHQQWGHGIRLWGLDIATGELSGDGRAIWPGFEDDRCEAPRIYRIDGTYYLIVAEGGTWRGHMVVCARSRSVGGPYEGCPRNPILTHRALVTEPVQSVGHGDLVHAHDGSWWIVFLGTRPVGDCHHLGRETFLTPVTWDDEGWPVVNGGRSVRPEMEAACLPAHAWPREPVRDDFEEPELRLCWNFRRNPAPGSWSLRERPGWLRLRGRRATLDQAERVAFVGRRQQHFGCRATTRLEFEPARQGDEAGLTVLMNEAHRYEVSLAKRSGGKHVILRKRIGDVRSVVAQERAAAGPVTLRVEARRREYTFLYAVDDGPMRQLGRAPTRYVSSEVAGGFTGVYFGMYATGDGRRSEAPADFDWFDYEVLER
jgi:xylan 1,4-beta-xylosidase